MSKGEISVSSGERAADQAFYSYTLQKLATQSCAQGVTLGTIIASTTTFRPNVDTATPQHSGNQYIEHGETPETKYYSKRSPGARTAVLMCLAADKGKLEVPLKLAERTIIARLEKSQLTAPDKEIKDLEASVPSSSACTDLNLANTYQRWMARNTTFTYNSQPLDEWLDAPTTTIQNLIGFTAALTPLFFLIVLLGISISLIYLHTLTTRSLDSTFIGPIITACTTFTSLILFIFSVRSQIKNTTASLARNLDSTKKLVACDTGLLCLADSNTQIGDIVCLLSGYPGAVVLRRRDGHNLRGHSAVGTARACLNRQDRKRLKGFLHECDEVSVLKAVEGKKYKKVMGRYQMDGLLEYFNFVSG